jgi:hypothetical protein
MYARLVGIRPLHPTPRGGLPIGLIDSTFKPNRSKLRAMNARPWSSSRNAGCALGPVRVCTTSPSRLMAEAKASTRSLAAQAWASNSTPAGSSIR